MTKLLIVLLGVFIGVMLGIIGSWDFTAAYGLGVLSVLIVLQIYVLWGGAGVKVDTFSVAKYPKDVVTSGIYYVILGDTSKEDNRAVTLLNRRNRHRISFELPEHSRFREDGYAVEVADGYKIRDVARVRRKRRDETKKWS